ncbi:MAG: RluA family pseudouridine synthase [Lachnospiraceae bacterium]|nr:RluA family pseudouridine synthase [Lachnospiraceae bacterium]
MIRKLEYQIKEEQNGKTIQEFLKEKEYSRAILVELKKTKTGITKNGTWAFVNETLFSGDVLGIEVTEEESSENIVPMEGNLDILYEDEDILVVNKPYDMPIHPSVNNYDNTLANAVAYYYKSQNIPYVFRCINRLDRDTTGATVIAKNMLSAGILSKQVKERRLKRTYAALVEGVTKEEGIIDFPIGREEGTVIKRKVDLKEGKHAVTHYKRQQVVKVGEEEVSLLSLQLETGRTHQIRVHMSYIGHPLLGDFLYNETNHMLTRQALHSYKICFDHPVTGEYMEITAPLPADMQGLLDENRGNKKEL